MKNPVKVIKEKLAKSKAAKAEKVSKVEVKDESLNCPDCGGDGLKNQFTVCQKCLGTGKV